MSTAAQVLKVWKQLDTASYAFNVPPLALWTGLLARMLISKDRDKLTPLIVISILMILYSVAAIVNWQLAYTFNNRSYKEVLNHRELASQILQAC